MHRSSRLLDSILKIMTLRFWIFLCSAAQAEIFPNLNLAELIVRSDDHVRAYFALLTRGFACPAVTLIYNMHEGH